MSLEKGVYAIIHDATLEDHYNVQMIGGKQQKKVVSVFGDRGKKIQFNLFLLIFSENIFLCAEIVLYYVYLFIYLPFCSNYIPLTLVFCDRHNLCTCTLLICFESIIPK